MSINPAFLPLKQFHIVEIRNLDPNAIKRSAKKTKRDREKIPYNTRLNVIVKALGFKGGFAGYEIAYQTELVPFLKQHNLLNRANLLKPRKKEGVAFKDVGHQTLSERLFFSGRPLPKRVFTGYDYDYLNTICDGHYYLNTILCRCDNIGPFGLQESFSNTPDKIKNNLQIARAYADEVFSDNQYKAYGKRRLIDIVLGGFMFQITPSFNLIGDALVDPALQSPEVQLYSNGLRHDEYENEKGLYKSIFELFRERIEPCSEGWIDIIPFNKNLIFLKGKNGEYDFVFKNQRGKIFDHQIFGDALKRADVPTCMPDYHFQRWNYFEYEGFRDRDAHESENLFYNSGGLAADHPGVNQILFDYHDHKKTYSPSRTSSCLVEPGFDPVTIDDKTICISSLVSIEEFNLFLSAKPEYAEYRLGDNLESVNDSDDPSSPVAVTWFDALAYIDWFERERKIGVRLLKAAEFKAVRYDDEPNNLQNLSPPSDPLLKAVEFKVVSNDYQPINRHNSGLQSDLEFVDVDGSVFNGHPPYMHEDKFQELAFRFKNPPKLVKGRSGLDFVQSNDFAEWLLEATCIRSNNLTSFYYDPYILKSAPPKTSTGKYKGTKIGFRLCYELVGN